MNQARCLFAVVLAFAGVWPSLGQEVKQPAPKPYKHDFYPIAVGHKWVYRATDLKAPKAPEAVAAKPSTVVITVAGEQAFSIERKPTEPKELVVGFELQITGGGKVSREQVLVDFDGVYRVSGAGKAILPPLRILKDTPIKTGDSWKCDSQSESAALKGDFILKEDDVVQVPLGTFKAVLVRSKNFTVGAQKMELAVWYARDVGMVKQHMQSGNHEVILELEKFEKK